MKNDDVLEQLWIALDEAKREARTARHEAGHAAAAVLLAGTMAEMAVPDHAAAALGVDGLMPPDPHARFRLDGGVDRNTSAVGVVF